LGGFALYSAVMDRLGGRLNTCWGSLCPSASQLSLKYRPASTILTLLARANAIAALARA
jgi:hypothetical protein